ncbi:MAG TPA: FprA family A-type flavoprotein [Bacteroidales bacterium]|nr:FprA family A-type flavoprotein [Bacteroidales bacterium]HOH83413.1 FprA family A-type flavoprotein [Bacteroidales bacterium]
MKDNKILDITADVKWIGVLDPDIRTFDIVMETKYGATYNSYFINAQKKTVVEATKEKFWDVYLEKLKQVVNPEEIEYIVMNHTEPDHSGNAINLLKIAPNAKIVGTGNVIRYMTDLMNMDFPHIIVKEGDTLDLGNKTLRFINAPNLHWPDSMYSYLEEDKVLFTCDSFGSHYCHEEMYDDKVGNFDEAFKYYFDVILKPFSKYMLKAIEKIRPLDISAICNGHGPLLTKNWKRYVDLSEQYAKEAVALSEFGRALVAYVSAYGKTKILAESIAKGLSQVEGIHADLCDIEKMPAGELADKIAQASGIIIGSCTINQNTLPQVYTMFALMSPLRDKGKPAGCFGSYGWSGEAQKIIEANLSALKLNLVPDNIFVKFTPSADDITRCVEYGKSFAAKVLEVKCGV